MPEIPFTKDNLDSYLKELAKEFRKINGSRTPAEITLIGGAAVLVNYGFREMTYDVDAIIMIQRIHPPAVRKNVRGMNAPITNNATIIPTGFSSGIVGFSRPDVLQNAVIRCIALLFQEKHFR